MMEVDELQGCCGVGNIQNLHFCLTAKDAMWQFCNLLKRWEPGIPKTCRPLVTTNVKTFYLFTGVEHIVDQPLRENYSSRAAFEAALDDWHDEVVEDDDCPIGYCSAFEAYIHKHKLGEVQHPQTLKPNRTGGPTHIIGVWVWHPDPVALAAWWKLNWKTGR